MVSNGEEDLVVVQGMHRDFGVLRLIEDDGEFCHFKSRNGRPFKIRSEHVVSWEEARRELVAARLMGKSV